MYSFPSAKVVRPSVLELGLNCMTQWLMTCTDSLVAANRASINGVCVVYCFPCVLRNLLATEVGVARGDCLPNVVRL